VIATALAAVEHNPNDLHSLIHLAHVSFDGGYRNAAHTAALRAFTLDPQNVQCLVILGLCAYAKEQWDESIRYFENAIAIDPHSRLGHLGLGRNAWRQYQYSKAHAHFAQAFATSAVLERPATSAHPTRVLVLAHPAALNTPVDVFLPAADFHLIYWHLPYGFSDPPLPAYDVVFNAISDSGPSGPWSVGDEHIGARLKGDRIMNPVHAVALTERDRLSATLAGIPSLVVAAAQRLCVEAMLGLPPFETPHLLRPTGSHMGDGVWRVCGDEWKSLLFGEDKGLASEWFVGPFIDTQSADGLFRKYRLMCVDGQWYPAHLAMRSEWKVHYFSGELTAAQAVEQQRFLDDPRHVLTADQWAVFEQIAQRIPLGYFGVDFALDAHGRVVVFEANATMVAAVGAADDPRFKAAVRINDAAAHWVRRVASSTDAKAR